MKRVMNSVNLQDIGVQVGRVRRNREEQADRLTSHLREAIGEAARVGRPSRTTLVLVLNIS